MKVNKLIDELMKLKEKGFGETEVVVMEQIFRDKPYQTTVEELKITNGGAEYLTDKYIICPNGHKEGIFEGASIVIRTDGGEFEIIRKL